MSKNDPEDEYNWNVRASDKLVIPWSKPSVVSSLIELGRLREENHQLKKVLEKVDCINKSTLFSSHKVYLIKKLLSYWT